MKLKKFLGHILTVLGSVVLLIGIFAAILPNVTNRQMKLIIESFQTPSDHWLIQSMNNVITFAMNHVFLMILIGLVIIAIGVLLMISARTDAHLKAQSSTHQVKAGTAVVAAGAATAIAAGAVQPAAQQTKAANQGEGNPFARYLKEGNVPKSTAVPGSQSPEEFETVSQDDGHRNSNSVLSILGDFRQPPDSDGLFIQPIHIVNDEAYRRPVEDHYAELVLPDTDPVNADDPSFDESSIQMEAFSSEPLAAEVPASASTSEADHAPEAALPADAAALARPRPLIRSTFHKASAPQLAEEPAVPEHAEVPAEEPTLPDPQVELPESLPETLMEAPVEIPEIPAELQIETLPESPVEPPVQISEPPVETVPETTVESPALQPAPRIKSTMGRKR